MNAVAREALHTSLKNAYFDGQRDMLLSLIDAFTNVGQTHTADALRRHIPRVEARRAE